MMHNIRCNLQELKLYPKDVDKRGKKTICRFNVSPDGRTWMLGSILKGWSGLR